MSNEIMQENTPFVECSAFHRGMSVLEASLRNTEDTLADGASVRSSAPRPPVRRNSASKDGQIRCRAIPTQTKAALASCPRHDPVSP